MLNLSSRIMPSGVSLAGMPVKPNASFGLAIDGAHPWARNLIWFAINFGGQYVILRDCAPGHYMTPTNYYPETPYGVHPPYNASQISTQWGGGMQWQGVNGETDPPSGSGFNYAFSEVWSADTVRNAQNLHSLGTGAGLTIGTSFMQTVLWTVGGPALIFGRPGGAFEGPPFSNFSLVMQSTFGGNSGLKPQGYWNNNGTGTTLTATADFAMNKRHTAWLAAINTDPAGDCSIYLDVDGNIYGPTTGQNLYDSNADNEDQIMFGSCYHITSPKCYNNFGGAIWWGGMWARYVPPQERWAMQRSIYPILAPRIERALGIF
jgi:hypothetical protein